MFSGSSFLLFLLYFYSTFRNTLADSVVFGKAHKHSAMGCPANATCYSSCLTDASDYKTVFSLWFSLQHFSVWAEM